MTALGGLLNGTAGSAAGAGAAGAAGAAGTAATAAAPSFLSGLIKNGATLGKAAATGGQFGDVSNAFTSLFGAEPASGANLDFLNSFSVGGDRLSNQKQEDDLREPHKIMSLFNFLGQ